MLAMDIESVIRAEPEPKNLIRTSPKYKKNTRMNFVGYYKKYPPEVLLTESERVTRKNQNP